MQITSAKQILDILQPIPEHMFIINRFGDEDRKGKSCALGHIHRALSLTGDEDYFGDLTGYGAVELTNRFIQGKYNEDYHIAHVNNAPIHNGYNEPVIKDRVIHLLNDMIEAGY